jgi:L-amino acid N-acyltransferase
MIVRDAVAKDLPAIGEIYNVLIPTTTIAWSENTETLRQRQTWFRHQQQAGNPVLVAEDDATVVGFCSYGSFRGAGKWPGYRFTVEHTIHVSASHWGSGVAHALLRALIDRATAANIHVMVAAIDSANTASIRFHEKHEFVTVATMPEVGRKFDRWRDLVLMQRILGEHAPI